MSKPWIFFSTWLCQRDRFPHLEVRTVPRSVAFNSLVSACTAIRKFDGNLGSQHVHRLRNIGILQEQTGKFVWNLATWGLREAINISAEQVPYGVDDFESAKVTKEPATLIDVSMVQESPVKFECEYHSTVLLPGNPSMGTVDVVIGRVIAVHIKEEMLTGGILDIKKTQPIARCGYYQYTVVKGDL